MNKPDGLEGAIYFMQSNYRPCAVLVDNDRLFVQRYVHRAFACDRMTAPIAYQNGITVIDRYAVYDPGAEKLTVLLGWKVPDAELLRELNISLQILAPNGNNIRQTDRHLYDDLVPWSELELATADLSAGEYRLALILYNAVSLEKVAGEDLSSGETGTILPVLSFAVE